MSIQSTLNPILQTYNVLKTRSGTEPYLRSVKYIKYRVAISKLLVCSRALEIERGWYTSSITPVNERLCHTYQKVQDEFHFKMECKSNSDLRQTFINKLIARCPDFAELSQMEQFVYMLTNEDNVFDLVRRIYLQVLPTTKQYWKQPLKHILILLFVYKLYTCIYIYIYFKLLYIDIKSSSHIHEFYTSKCNRALLTFVAILWYLWWLCIPYLWYGYYMEVGDFMQMVIYLRSAYLMHVHLYIYVCVYICIAQFDFTWTLYTRDFTWTLYITDNTVYIHLRINTCFMLFLIVCVIVL